MSWKFHPRLKERENIFVGRNSLIEEIEERFDDFKKKPIVTLIISGLPSIGRKALLRYATKKANIVRESYEYPLITLYSEDSIEDFILKIYDLGFADEPDLRSQLAGTISQKVALAIKLVEQLAKEEERVIIEDNGVIVQYDGEIVDWYKEIISSIEKYEKLIFCIASRLRPNKAINHNNEAFYCLYVGELEPPERIGLLKRYSKFKNLNLAIEDYSFFFQTC